MAATSAARNRANEVPARLPISDYDRLSVKEIVPLLAPLSDTELQLVVAHEKATKNRVTLLRNMKRIELSSPPGTPRPAPRKTPAPAARSKPARQPSKKPAPQPGLEAIADSVNGNGSAAPSAQAAPSVQAEPSVQYKPTPAPEAPPTRAGRGRRSVRKLRKEKAAAKATETDNNGSRQRHPSTGLRSVEPDLEEREAAAAPRPRPPAVHSRWEEEVPPVELTWELEDDDAPSVEDLVISPEVRERLNAPEVQARPKTEVKARPKTEVAEPEVAQPEVPQPEPQHPLDEWDDEDEDEGEGDQAPEPWGIDDFPDVAGESEHGASEEPALRSVPTPIDVDESVEDMVPRHSASEAYEIDDRIDDDDLPSAPVSPPAKVKPVRATKVKPVRATKVTPVRAAKVKPVRAAKVTPVRTAKVTPLRQSPPPPPPRPVPISPAERIISQPLPPKPEWMKDEPTQVILPSAPAPKEPVFRSIKSAVVPDMPKPSITSVLWVAAAIVAIVVGILIGMVATRTSPPKAVQMEQTNSVTYVAPSQT